MLRVVDVDYIKDYELLITFSDGNRKSRKILSQYLAAFLKS